MLMTPNWGHIPMIYFNLQPLKPLYMVTGALGTQLREAFKKKHLLFFFLKASLIGFKKCSDILYIYGWVSVNFSQNDNERLDYCTHCPENLVRHEVSGKLCSKPVPSRPHCPFKQRSRPFWEKCSQNIEIALEKIFENCSIRVLHIFLSSQIFLL